MPRKIISVTLVDFKRSSGYKHFLLQYGSIFFSFSFLSFLKKNVQIITIRLSFYI